MRVISVIADIPVGDIGSASGFYADLLGLSVEKFNLGWVARYTSPDTGAHPQLVTRDAPAPENPVVSVKVDDVEAVLEQAHVTGYEIVNPLTTEPWGVRRFFVRAPDGNVFDIVQQHAELCVGGQRSSPVMIRKWPNGPRRLPGRLPISRGTYYQPRGLTHDPTTKQDSVRPGLLRDRVCGR